MEPRQVVNALYVEADEKDYNLVKEIIKDFVILDIRLSWVKNYTEAIALLEKKQHELYLIAYKLPDSSGLELLKAMHKHDPRKSSCYIMITRYSTTQLEMEALDSGMDNYISKQDLHPALLERNIRYTLERKRNYLELERSRNQYRQIYQNTTTPIIELDTDLNVLKLNKAFNITFGYPPEFSVNPNVDRVKIWEIMGCEESKAHLIDHIKQKRNRTDEVFIIKNKEEDVLTVEIDVYELIGFEEVQTYQLVINDLTEKLKKERQRAQEERIDLMEKMARIVAHEVRNPLSNIVLANEQTLSLTGEEGEIYADIIKRNAVRIEDLIKRFLNTFKRAEVKMEMGSLNELVTSCVNGFDDRARLTEVELLMHKEEDLPEILIDHEKIMLVLNNLLNNAMKATEPFEDGKIDIHTQRKNDSIQVVIRDNGVGINDEDMKNLFEPFFTKSTGGLGLGLTTARNIIKSHNGTLLAEQNESRGATFILTLPVSNPKS